MAFPVYSCEDILIHREHHSLLVEKMPPSFREGAGDCSSCVAVMLELARGVSQWAHGFKHGVIFLFNTGEEEGLTGAHSFITQVGNISLFDYLYFELLSSLSYFYLCDIFLL